MELIKGDIPEHKNQNIMAKSEFAEWALHDQGEDYHHDEL